MARFASVRDAATPLTSASVGKPQTMKCSNGDVMPRSLVPTSCVSARLRCASRCARVHSLFSFVNASGLNHDEGFDPARLDAADPLAASLAGYVSLAPSSPGIARPVPGPRLDCVPAVPALASAPAAVGPNTES